MEESGQYLASKPRFRFRVRNSVQLILALTLWISRVYVCRKS